LLEGEPEQVLEYLWSIIPQEPTSFVRGQLGRMLFSGEDVDKKTTTLSGGEAARLVFSRLIVRKPNVLVLDEPTNHLDLESIEALVAALRAYEGTIIFVSHDRWFVSQLANRVIELTPDGYSDYPGSYDDYLARAGEDHLDRDAVVLKAKRERSQGKDTPGDWGDQKRQRAHERKLMAHRDQVTTEIEQGEARVAAIEAMYCEDGFFEHTAPAQIEALAAEQEALRATLAALMGEWERIELEVESLGLAD
jgi:energy-coupling factor transporter ATP-binding protein EcfA2